MDEKCNIALLPCICPTCPTCLECKECEKCPEIASPVCETASASEIFEPQRIPIGEEITSPFVRFAMLFRMRAGSTWLCAMLDAHSKVLL